MWRLPDVAPDLVDDVVKRAVHVLVVGSMMGRLTENAFMERCPAWLLLNVQRRRAEGSVLREPWGVERC